jgi:RNA polymerase sigma-70 factor (ECF subfamily)
MVTPAITTIEMPAPAPADSVPDYVQRAISGDARAFRELYRHHRMDVARLVTRLIGPRTDLDDVIQEVFIQVFRSLPKFRSEARFSTWLHRVTVNVTLMHLRATKNAPVLAGEGVQDAAPCDRPSPLDHATRRERVAALYRLLDQLPDKKRTVFILHDLEGLSPGEIATMVDAPILTVRTRLFYARRELYAAMASDPALDSVAKELAENGGKLR